jgi:hypothetical protein
MSMRQMTNNHEINNIVFIRGKNNENMRQKTNKDNGSFYILIVIKSSQSMRVDLKVLFFNQAFQKNMNLLVL